MVTALDLVTDGLQLCGVLADGATADAAQGAHGLRVLNQMLSAWRLNSLLVYAIDRQVFSLVSNQQTYTIGTGGDFNTTRPVRIEKAGWVDNSLSPALEIPVRVLTDDEYQDIRLKGFTSTLPTWMYYDQSYPLGNVYFYPGPTLARQVALYLWHPLGTLAGLSTTFDMPPGYEEMVLYNLAKRLNMAYPGSALSAEAKQHAEDSMSLVESQNSAAPVLGYPAGLGRSRVGYNYLTDNV